MLKPRVCESHGSKTFFLLNKPFIHGNGSASLSIWSKSLFQKPHKKIRTGFVPSNIKAVASPATEKSVSVKAVVTVKPTVRGFLSNLGVGRGLDDIKDLLGKTLLLELVSSELDPSKYSLKLRNQPYIINVTMISWTGH
jgi:lipoxygenase